jgi:hypothetical protein
MTYKISGLGIGAFCNAQVGNQVGKTVRFDDCEDFRMANNSKIKIITCDDTNIRELWINKH